MALSLRRLMRGLRLGRPPVSKKKHGASPAPVLSNGNVEFAILDVPNKSWRGTKRGSRVTFVRAPVLRRGDKVLTIGSCFALEIKHALHERDFDVFPKYAEIAFDPATQTIGKLPALDDINHYNSFTIGMEFERAFAGTHCDPEDFVKHSGRAARLFGSLAPEIWQDPYRRHIFASSKEGIIDLSRKLDLCIRDAIMNADVYVITPGVTEVWRNDRNGLYINQAPTPERNGLCPGFTFEPSSYAQNYANLQRVCSLLKEHFPQRKIILSVSPVALKQTFSGSDIVVANMESKSILRAVAGALSREFENVIYWPSYEIVVSRDTCEEDGRHVRSDVVGAIVDQFLAVHLDG